MSKEKYKNHKIIHGVRYGSESKRHRRLMIQTARAERKKQRFGNFVVQMFSFMF